MGQLYQKTSTECSLTSHRLLGVEDQFSYQSRDVESGGSAPTKGFPFDTAEQLPDGNRHDLLATQIPCTRQAQCQRGVERCHQQSMSLIKSLSVH